MTGALWFALSLAGSDVSAEGYRALVERYRGGDAPGAVAELAGWTPAQVQGAVEGLGRKAPNLPARAAAMLHTDTALLARRRGEIAKEGLHLDLARRSLETLPDRADHQTFRRDWLLAMGVYCLYVFDPDRSFAYLREGLRRFPKDPELLLASGALHEAAATLPAPARSAPGSATRHAPTTTALGDTASPIERSDALYSWMFAAEFSVNDLGPREALVTAERQYRDALVAEPGLEGAHLRLGRVLARLGHADAAQAELSWVVKNSRRPERLYLAHLFLGRVQEEQGRFADAAGSYRAAAAAVPSWPTASFALSEVLHRLGQRVESRQALQAALAAQDPRPPDGWWLYPYGPHELFGPPVERLRQEASAWQP